MPEWTRLQNVHSAAELRQLAVDLGVRPDWHEPEKQGLTAHVEGESFDNAGFWPAERCDLPSDRIELHVILTRNGEDIAAVNLATLFAWACGTDR